MYSILIFSIVLIIVYQYQLYKYRDNQFQIVSINQLDDLNTGDIVMFKCDILTPYNGPLYHRLILPVLRLFTVAHGYFTHCGIVIKKNNIPYVYHIQPDNEYDNYFNKTSIGPSRLTHFKDLNKTFGKTYVYKYNGPTYSDNHIYTVLDALKNDTYMASVMKYLVCNVFKLSNHIDVSYICTDHLEKTLYHLGMTTHWSKKANMVN